MKLMSYVAKYGSGKNSGVHPRSKGISVFPISRSIKEIEFICDRADVIEAWESNALH